MNRYSGVRLVGPATLALVVAAGLMTSPAMSQHKDGGDRNVGASTQERCFCAEWSKSVVVFQQGQ